MSSPEAEPIHNEDRFTFAPVHCPGCCGRIDRFVGGGTKACPGCAPSAEVAAVIEAARTYMECFEPVDIPRSIGRREWCALRAALAALDGGK